MGNVRGNCLGKVFGGKLTKGNLWGECLTEGNGIAMEEFTRVPVMICDTLFNIQTHRQTTFDRLHY